MNKFKVGDIIFWEHHTDIIIKKKENFYYYSDLFKRNIEWSDNMWSLYKTILNEDL